MNFITSARPGDRAVMVLTGTVVAVAVMATLYWAQKLLIPLALTVFFAFVLTPIVVQLQRWGCNRVVAVITVTLFNVTLFIGCGWLLASQLISLTAEAPAYSANIKKKFEAIQDAFQTSALSRLTEDFRSVPTPEPANKAGGGLEAPTLPIPQPLPIVVDQAEPYWLRWLPSVFGSAAEFLGQAGLVAVLVVFVLLAREDLRNRFVSLVGHGRLTVTTKAVDDASQRLSRFLLMQLIINVIFGCCVTLGLWIIGVHFALLWGVLAGALRYVPYVGSPLAALFPIALSVAQFDGWLQPALVAILIVGLEVLAANVFEPMLFGHSIGASAVALLVAAAFWAFLWGPIGLVLSCPLTVCLVVLGKYVPNLGFLSILLSDEPALEQDFAFYQRLSAHDDDEAADIAFQYAEKHGPEKVYDGLLIPALTYAARDFQRQGLDAEDLQFIRAAAHDVVDSMDDMGADTPTSASPAGGARDSLTAEPHAVPILGVAARDQSDETALKMLGQLLKGEACELRIAGANVLSSELLTLIEEHAPAAVCIAALPPGGQARARYLCKRLRSRFPELRIVVGRWGLHPLEQEQEKSLMLAGANQVRTTLVATRDDILAWLPALLESAADSKTNRDNQPKANSNLKEVFQKVAT